MILCMLGILMGMVLRPNSLNHHSNQMATTSVTAAQATSPRAARGTRSAAGMPPRKKLTIEERMYLDRHDEDLDWERAEGPDPRDPRCKAGSCKGQHMALKPSARIANQHMVQVLGLRQT